MQTMSSIHIKKADASDNIVLQSISRQTFHEAFAAMNTEENMRKYMDESLSLEKLTSELNNPDSSFYFAMDGDAVIGYLKLNMGDTQTELQGSQALEIERIYVLQSYYGKEVGKLLFEKAMTEAREREAAFVWLGVWEENHRAIRFYEKNGFVPFDKHHFMLGDDEQTDIMMKLNLNTH